MLKAVASQPYTKDFYESLRNGVMRSAEVIVPLVLKLVPARSVVDIGCGDGSWLAVFRRQGVDEILGLDGDYVDRATLQIPAECFREYDLRVPLEIKRKFDLAISLEVAEHLPPECAGTFVRGLTELAPIVLFSAAIPFQGGTHHLNEQWPNKWVELFRERGYVPVDFVRKRVWQNEGVEFWYAQNTLLFVQQSVAERSDSLREELKRTNLDQLSLVHPRQYLHLQTKYLEAIARAENPLPSGVKQASRFLLVCLKNSLKKRLGFQRGRPSDEGMR
jgi:SAM-dependent methyltransferase